jgi:aldehyde:ferredoxin oxidoreductase
MRGRGGSGAVLGSKNIKAIAIRGNKAMAGAPELTDSSRDLSARSFGPATAKLTELGTATNMLTFNRFGTLPTRNFQSGTFEEAERLSPEGDERDARTHPRQLRGLHDRLRAHHALGGSGVRVEYESLFALGSLCGVGDPDAVLRASQRCDELGIDTISAGGTIAFAMECVERGLIDEPWLRFGDGEALLRAIELIGAREGLGVLLAEGSRRAALAIGRWSLPARQAKVSSSDTSRVRRRWRLARRRGARRRPQPKRCDEVVWTGSTAGAVLDGGARDQTETRPR